MNRIWQIWVGTKNEENNQKSHVGLSKSFQKATKKTDKERGYIYEGGLEQFTNQRRHISSWLG